MNKGVVENWKRKWKCERKEGKKGRPKEIKEKKR